MSIPTKRIAVIVSSTRPNRIGDKVGDFVKSILDNAPEGEVPVSLSLVDVAKFNLPLLDEPVMPGAVTDITKFAHEHSLAWNKEIASYDAYVFLTAEYNGGPPGATKNAIDYLYHAWLGKPVMVISYGIFGGSGSNEAVRKSLGTIQHLKVVDTHPQMAFPGRNPEQRNMSTSLLATMKGELHTEAVDAWTADHKDEILKGFEEIKAALITPVS